MIQFLKTALCIIVGTHIQIVRVLCKICLFKVLAAIEQGEIFCSGRNPHLYLQQTPVPLLFFRCDVEIDKFKIKPVLNT